jgi:uncharacterized protein YbaP (TraB family)
MRRVPGFKAWLFLCCLLIAPLAALAEAGFSEGLLFRVQGSDGTASYLFGTIHSEDPRVTKLPQQVRAAFDASATLALEVDMDPLSLLSAAGAMMLEEGQDLHSLVGDATYERCRETAKRLGLPESVLNRYKPWAVAVLFSLPPVDSGQFLDLLLYQAASARAKTIVGLETVDEQLGTFDGLSMTDQIALLEDAIENIEQLPKLLEALISTYLRRDLRGLTELSLENFQGDSEIMGRFQEAAIFSRNRRMVDRLTPYIERGGVFAAVGALHLPGEQGMLNLLQQRGYPVEKRY